MKLLGVHFAPLFIPVKRRLQTFAVFYHVYTFFFMGLWSSVFLFCLLFTPFFWITILYTIWYIYDLNQSSRGGRQFLWTRRWPLWKWYRDYFPIKLIKTANLDPEHNYIMGSHPHGINGLGAFCALLTDACGFPEKFPGITCRVLSLKLMHYFPLWREYIMALGLCDVSKESIQALLKDGVKGTALTIVVGGAKEVFEMEPGVCRLVLKSRRGFVKMAIQTGAYLVPTFSFGENDIYRLLFSSAPGSTARKIQRFLQVHLGVAPILFFGRGVFNYTFGFMPYRKPITVVVGRPIPVVQNPNPTNEEVIAIHQQYLDELKDLFDTYKTEAGYADDVLEFID